MEGMKSTRSSCVHTDDALRTVVRLARGLEHCCLFVTKKTTALATTTRVAFVDIGSAETC